MKRLTVITTTYNRAYCIHQVYDSLVKQDCQDFIWLIVDDGSSDGTAELINKYIKEGKIEIEYYYKENGGMHTARNFAYDKVQTELNVIIDSDDWMVPDAVGRIIKFWDENKSDGISGIISNNIDPEGKMIGKPLPLDISFCTHTELVDKYHIVDDKKLIFRSELTKLYPYPEFPGEKFYPASYKFRMLDLKYKMILMHESTCVVNYGADSMSYAKKEQYFSCPKGFAHYRNEMIRLSKSPQYIIKQMIHYIAECTIAGNRHMIMESSKPFIALITFAFGKMYYAYLQCSRKQK